MKNTILRILIMGSLVALTACGGGGDSTTPPPATISLIAANSTSIDLQSTDLQGSISTACYTNNSNGVIETVSISGLTWTYTVKTHAGDTSCSNTPSTTTAVATLTIGSNKNVASWVDGNSDPAAAPASAADSNTNLSANAPYTVISGEVTSSNNPDIAVGITFTSGYVIDNSSASGVVLYRVKNTVTGEATTADPYTDIVPVSPPAVSGPEIQITIDEVVNLSTTSSRIQYTIKNIGDTDTGSFYVVGWHDRASAPNYTSASSGKIMPHANLASGATEIAYVTLDAINVTPGTAYNAYVIADFGEAVTEFDEGLTGTNDNLSTKAWTVSDVYIHNGSTYVDNGTDPVIKAEYHITYGRTDITFNRQFISGSGFNHQHTVKLLGALPITDTTATGYSSIRVDFYINGVYYTLPTDDTTSEIRIISAGLVGENVWGTYDVNLCPVLDLSGAGTCNVATVNHIGNFQVVRDADVTP